jgi:hypothetical protein
LASNVASPDWRYEGTYRPSLARRSDAALTERIRSLELREWAIIGNALVVGACAVFALTIAWGLRRVRQLGVGSISGEKPGAHTSHGPVAI